MDRLKQQLGDSVIVLAGASGGKVALVAGVNGSPTGKVKAGELLGHIASQIGGKGGGRPDLAQGGGEDGPPLRPHSTVSPLGQATLGLNTCPAMPCWLAGCPATISGLFPLRRARLTQEAVDAGGKSTGSRRFAKC